MSQRHQQYYWKKTLFIHFFPSDFTDFGQRSTLEMNRLAYWIISSCVSSTTYHQYLFKTSSRHHDIVAEGTKVNFHLVAWTLASHFTPRVLLEWRLWLEFFFNIYFLLCLLLWSTVCGGVLHKREKESSFYSAFVWINMTLHDRKCKLRSIKRADWGSNLWQMLLL